MGYNQRFVLFVASLFMLGFGYWASTFAGIFITENRPLMFGLFFFGLCLIMSHAFISAMTFAKIEKRIAVLEGDPETPDRQKK